MDNKQIEKAVENLAHIRIGNKDIDLLCSLAQLFLSVKGMPKKKEHFCILSNKELKITGKLVEGRTIADWIKYGYNQAIDEFTAWFVGRMDGIERTVREFLPHRDEEYVIPLFETFWGGDVYVLGWDAPSKTYD